MADKTELQRLSGKSNWRKLKIKGAARALKEVAGELQEYMTADQLREFERNIDKVDNLLCRINDAKYLEESAKLARVRPAKKLTISAETKAAIDYINKQASQ